MSRTSLDFDSPECPLDSPTGWGKYFTEGRPLADHSMLLEAAREVQVSTEACGGARCGIWEFAKPSGRAILSAKPMVLGYQHWIWGNAHIVNDGWLIWARRLGGSVANIERKPGTNGDIIYTMMVRTGVETQRFKGNYGVIRRIWLLKPIHEQASDLGSTEGELDTADMGYQQTTDQFCEYFNLSHSDLHGLEISHPLPGFAAVAAEWRGHLGDPAEVRRDLLWLLGTLLESCERSNMLQLPSPKQLYINCSYIHYTTMLLTTLTFCCTEVRSMGCRSSWCQYYSLKRSKEPRNEDPQQDGLLKYWRINLLAFIKPRSEGKDLMAINLLRLGIHFSSGHAGQLWRLATCQRIPPGLPIQTRWSAVTFSAFEFEDLKRFPKSSLGISRLCCNLIQFVLRHSLRWDELTAVSPHFWV